MLEPNVWHNFGDEDFLEHGLMLKAREDEGEFEVISCRFIFGSEDHAYEFTTGLIDIKDDQIDWDAVISFAEIDRDSAEPEELAVAALEYYTPEKFCRHGFERLKAKEVRERMDDIARAFIFTDYPWRGPLL